MRTIFKGPTGSGKTEKLYQTYRHLCQKDGSKDKLVLLYNAQSVRSFRNRVDLEKIDSLNIYSYFGFLQGEIRNYWDLIAASLAGGQKRLQPIFMTVEPAHYIMSEIVKKEQEKGHFNLLKSTPQQIAVQLIDNLNHAALNLLTVTEAESKLLTLADDEDKELAYKRGAKVMSAFHDYCLQYRCIDYSLLITLYHKYLLRTEEYRNILANKYNYIFVDDLQLSSLSGQKLILQLEEFTTDSYLSFNPQAQRGSFFGAAPWLVEENFSESEELIELKESKTASAKAVEFARSLEAKIMQGRELAEQDFVREVIKTEFRGEMLLEVANKAIELVGKGVKAEKIALLTPFPDRVLEFSITKALGQSELELVSLTKNRLLLDNTFAKALIVLTLLVKSDWQVDISQYSILKSFCLVFQLDPSRASLLAKEVYNNGKKLELVDLDETKLRDKLGFKVGEEYDAFKSWVETKREQELELNLLFKEVFASFLTTLSYQQEDILACRQLISSFDKFKQVMQEFKKDFSQQDLGHRFIKMILERTLAADILLASNDLKDKVLLTTPYTFLNSPQVTEVEYIFLLDASSQLWFMGANKELSNPHILSQQEENWSDSKEQATRQKQLVDYLKNILFKTRAGIYVFRSNLNSKGWEQDGQLADWLEGY